uniref:Uncharacterized protein n=1 Tax=Kalanchoe fedtschenkoi TaxID=63787 RepID=A0A7N0ZRZ8_KALFE
MATLPLCNLQHSIFRLEDRRLTLISYSEHHRRVQIGDRNVKLRLRSSDRNLRFVTRLKSASVNGVSIGKIAEGREVREVDVELGERIRRWVGIVSSVLPGGSWWWSFSDEEVIVSAAKPVTLWRALSKMWELVSRDRWVIFAAFSALIITALSEISIPHFLTASIFTAQSGEVDAGKKGMSGLTTVRSATSTSTLNVP